MLQHFLATHRSELIERCRAKVAARRAPRATPIELEQGIPLFLDQLTSVLAGTQNKDQARSPADDGSARHGAQLLAQGLAIDQAVHAYGDLCQAITELAAEQDAPITVREFGTLNIRLDNAIASAVTEYSRRSQLDTREQDSTEMNARLGVLAHEMRNHLNTTILALAAIKSGGVGFGGATAAALDRSLIGMRTLVDRTLTIVRLESVVRPPAENLDIAQLFAELRVTAALEATQRGCELSVDPGRPGLRVAIDGHVLTSAVLNLLQNAFKFTRPHTHVLLRAFSLEDRVLIEVEDECGGLSCEIEPKMFHPFQQGGADRTGVGLGLFLSREGIESYGGKLRVRNIPGQGCVFTIDLPAVA